MAEMKPIAAARSMTPKPMFRRLSIFRPYVNMVLSIMRLISAAMGKPQFNTVSSFIGSPTLVSS